MKVSCITPTANRPEFLENAIELFLRQDYEDRELIVVYNSWSDLPAMTPHDKRVFFVRTDEMSIGGKRNVACERATGGIIILWDDDDWYAESRVSTQVAPILSGAATVTGLTNTHFFDCLSWEVSVLSDSEHKRVFSNNVAGGTIAFLKRAWVRQRFDNISLREDANFLEAILRNGETLSSIDGSSIYKYVRHQGNTWRLKNWNYAYAPPTEGMDFYALIKQKHDRRQPRVSCIMPTCDRPKFIAGAVDGFLRQRYSNKELIILDDGDPVGGLFKRSPNIAYRRNNGKLTIGEKRNFCCEMATGDIIVHLDDDDWYSSDWLSNCASRLQCYDVCGVRDPLFYDSSKPQLYRYNGAENWVAGATLAYKKEAWLKSRFKPIQIGEDNDFVSRQKSIGEIPSNMFVGRVHKSNTSRKKTGDLVKYSPLPIDLLPIDSLDYWGD